MKVLVGVITEDNIHLKCMLADNEDVLVGGTSLLVAEVARKLGKNDKDDAKLWIDTILETSKDILEKGMI